jgi:hypothetical protein
VGQDEVEIASAAHSVVVVSVPGLGDDVQAIKAGVLEIADVHVVNKADREGADRTIADLRNMLMLAPMREGARMPPVLACVAAREEGIDALWDALAAHLDELKATGELERRRARIAHKRVLGIAHEVLARAVADPARGDTGAAAGPRGPPRAVAACRRPGAARHLARRHQIGDAAMFDRDAIERARRLAAAWEGNELRSFIERQPETRPGYETLSGLPVNRVYTPADIAETPFEEIGLPGQFPYTRGPYPTMYRGRLWTMRQIAGFGTGEDTNGRFRYLIEQGQTGLSVDFDMPTLMGLDSDDPKCLGEVGREGVAVDTLDDVEALFDGIDLERISVSMTINPSAWILLAMYVALAQSRGLDLNRLSGTVQATSSRSTSRRRSGSSPSAPPCGSCAT